MCPPPPGLGHHILMGPCSGSPPAGMASSLARPPGRLPPVAQTQFTKLPVLVKGSVSLAPSPVQFPETRTGIDVAGLPLPRGVFTSNCALSVHPVAPDFFQ